MINPLGLPRIEDITELDIADHHISIVTITDENRATLAEAALSMYANEPCRICGITLTMDDLRNGAVFAGYNVDNSVRSAHLSCWRADIPKSKWVHQ